MVSTLKGTVAGTCQVHAVKAFEALGRNKSFSDFVKADACESELIEIFGTLLWHKRRVVALFSLYFLVRRAAPIHAQEFKKICGIVLGLLQGTEDARLVITIWPEA